MGEVDQSVPPPPPPPGEPVSTVQLPVPPAPTAEAAGSPPPGRRGGRGKLIAIVLAVLLVAGAIVGIALAAGGGGTKKPAAAPSSAAAPVVGEPVGLAATADVAPFQVTLSWSSPAGDAKILGYKIWRDDLQVAAVPAETTTYVDQNVFPGRTFTYSVVTRGEGILESDRVSTQVEVPFPPISAARLEGSFNVKLHTLSQSGYIGSLGDFTVGWGFAPKCESGACSVVWRDLNEKTIKAALARKGATYSGSDSGKFLGECGNVMGTTTVTVSFRVTKARASGQKWIATKLVGTLTEHHASQLGCTSGGATFKVTATLVS